MRYKDGNAVLDDIPFLRNRMIYQADCGLDTKKELLKIKSSFFGAGDVTQNKTSASPRRPDGILPQGGNLRIMP